MKGYLGYGFRENFALKGLRVLQEQPSIFSRKDAPDVLGFGSSMVRATAFWLTASDLCRKSRKEWILTDFGQEIIQNDAYLEDAKSLWKIHFRIIDNSQSLPIFHAFFRHTEINRPYTKEELVVLMKKYCPLLSNETIREELNVLLLTYIHDEKRFLDPEDNTRSLLSPLCLVEQSEEGIVRNQPDLRLFPYEISEDVLFLCSSRFGTCFSFDIYMSYMDLYCNLKPVTARSFIDKLSNYICRLDYSAGNNIIYMNENVYS